MCPLAYKFFLLISHNWEVYQALNMHIRVRREDGKVKKLSFNQDLYKQMYKKDSLKVEVCISTQDGLNFKLS